MDTIRITKRLPDGCCHVLMAELHWKQFYTESTNESSGLVSQRALPFDETALLLLEVEIAANRDLQYRVHITGNDLPL